MSNLSINLTIDSDRLDRFCEKLMKRSRNADKTHDSLVTLEAFLCQISNDSQGSSQFEHVINRLRQHCDKSRQQFLSEKAERLVGALRALNVVAVTEVYLPLSRSGFKDVMSKIIDRFSELELSIISDWSEQWLSYSRQKAAEASEYPDSLDFNRAGIRYDEFQAMTDLASFLANCHRLDDHQGAA